MSQVSDAALRHAHVFCAVVDAGSFSSAARRLGVTPAAISRSIATLEADLGTALIRRTTRRMSLTDDGVRFGEAARGALELLADARRAVGDVAAAPRGRVRLSVPTTYGHARVLPAIAALHARHPDVRVDVDVSNRNVDVIGEGFDLAVRMGELGDSTLVARKLEDAELAIYASPAYLERAGEPRKLEQLAAHALIGFVRPSSGRTLPWLLRGKRGEPVEHEPARGLRCGDDFLGCVTLARAGAGLVQCYRFIADAHVARGELVEVLAAHAGRTRPFRLLQPRRVGAGSAATRAVAEAIVAAVPKVGSLR